MNYFWVTNLSAFNSIGKLIAFLRPNETSHFSVLNNLPNSCGFQLKDKNQ